MMRKGPSVRSGDFSGTQFSYLQIKSLSFYSGNIQQTFFPYETAPCNVANNVST